MTQLTKSKAMLGLQCTKALWLHTHQPELASSTNHEESLFSAGTSVGELARQYFHGGELINANRSIQMSEQTQKLIQTGCTTLYEATFVSDVLTASIDILHKDESGWHIYEVKSSTQVKETHINDVTLQYMAMFAATGIQPASVNIMHINNAYERGEKLDVQSLFTVANITEEVMALSEPLQQKVDELISLQDTKQVPEINIGVHCSSPYECRFSHHCKQDIPFPSVFNLYRLNKVKKFSYFHEGIVSYKDAKAAIKLSKVQQLQVDSYLSQKPLINEAIIRDFIDTVNYPISYFDFETFNEAIPRFAGQRPYMQMPFQYSLHVEDNKGNLTHTEYLASEHEDPRVPLIEKMLNDLPASGSIMAFNQSFEITRLKELALAYPQYSQQISELIPRFVDLMKPFTNLGYYHPDFHGSFSIKSILPAMFPNSVDLDYKSLSIKNGGMAMETFANLHLLKDGDKREDIRRDLLAYCKLDTLAMVKIYRALLSLI